jgi:transcriptional regulator
MSKNKATKIELQKYASLWLKHTGLNETEIADKLGTDIDNVLLWIREDNLKTSKKSPFINETFGKKTKNVSIMTKEASQQSDANRSSVKQENRFDKNIFRPNG